MKVTITKKPVEHIVKIVLEDGETVTIQTTKYLEKYEMATIYASDGREICHERLENITIVDKFGNRL
jgi:hypothetical protein